MHWIRHVIAGMTGLVEGRQHFTGTRCLWNMARKKNEHPKVDQDRVQDETIYDMRTPLWSKYYNEVRKHIRFPRYYKKALNW